MRVRLTILFCACFFRVAAFVVPDVLVSAQEITKDELIAAYENSFASLHSFDVTYATGNIARWEDWKPKSTHQQQFRWRKSGDIERLDECEYIDDVVVSRDTDQGNGEESMVKMLIPAYSRYTDGSKYWRLYGDISKAEGIDLIDQKGLVAEIRFLANDDILSAFPYRDFYFSLFSDEHKQWCLITQILKEFRTEIIDRRQNGNDTIVTTRSFPPSMGENSKHFVQISFDSSVGYMPRQLIFTFEAKSTVGAGPLLYLVKDFVEYHVSEDGAFFPVKIQSCFTEDINKLEDRTVTGRVAVSSITVNQPIDVPAIEFPPGVIVVVDEGPEKFESYIWGQDNKPQKVLTEDDYKAAKEARILARGQVVLPTRFSITRIILIVVGLALIFITFAIRALRRR